ncbi:PepSY-associated TM helix domain-containing protein [Hyalangium rubrum]|uniref:PepSY-associated TM helix domain-containing protein n=1 Tax=Hyalangium rubrum TaxID=3103134 RepID=A0ABU5HGG3_9BACT|nr:PepSY-associated TM helix domain-containing protein [Hyalangium sp. s54d21]MDY7232547.1 PepSY-associated TM helix domain-containing protein [Hyalangium sp. s54d21]
MRLRRFLFKVHLYAGLTVGAVLVVTGLTGAVLVFEEELEGALDPEVRRVVPGPERVPFSQVLAAVVENQGGTQPRMLRIPERHDAPIEAWMGGGRDAVKVYVNPYTAQVLGSRNPSDSVVGIVRDLHIRLLAGKAGETVVGGLGVALLLLSVTGIIVWWPGRRKLAEGFKVRRPLRWRRGNFDLHKVSGAVTLVFLLLAGLTGTALVFPAPFQWMLKPLQASTPKATPTPPGPATGEPLSLDALMAVASRTMPGAHPTRIELPATPDAALKVRMRFPQEPHPNGMSFVFVDRHSGAVLYAESALKASAASRLMALRYPIHIGQIGGMVTRVLAVLTGLSLVGLFFTGLFLWHARTRATPAPRPAQSSTPPTQPSMS